MTFPFHGDSSYFLDLYARYRQDPLSVPQDWRLQFEGFAAPPAEPVTASRAGVDKIILNAFRDNGYKEATLDPLGIQPRGRSAHLDLARSLAKAGQGRLRIEGTGEDLPVGEAIEALSKIYSGAAAVQADHVNDPDLRDWLFRTYETELSRRPDTSTLARTLEAVLLADEFEKTLKKKWPTKKRFGSEGSEGSMVLLREAFREARRSGYREAVIGGMHRGRLASLATVFGKTLSTLIAEIKGVDVTEGDDQFTGDVPYHNGLLASVSVDGEPFEVRVLPHPSHLSVVAAVALGASRARGELRENGKVLSLILHTDAAFEGQGLISEVLQIDGLAGYTSGGAIHIVVNNQIGFTTLPEEGRSTPHPTDIGRAYGLPIFHVNGDDPVAASAVMRVAVAWRNQTGKGSLINLVCYRRNGHNELDEPRFTQPKTSSVIDGHPPLSALYGDRVRALNARAAEAAEAARASFAGELAAAFRSLEGSNKPHSTSETIVFPEPRHERVEAGTAVSLAFLQDVAASITEIPADYDADAKVSAFYAARLDSVRAGRGINMATAEALAFGTLLAEGTSVRISGQDAVRGTFTQRHLAVHDRATGRSMMPTRQAARDGARFDAINSPLIEYGILSFEYGMSLADPNRLIMWEAQFGDFLNGAQIVVDQFILTAKAKWLMESSLVVALPHGLEGQGPDHSSARIERILQSCVADNIYLANPSTPANLFHLLRRQQRGAYRRPLFLIAPKSLLRQKACTSRAEDFCQGSTFEPVIETPANGSCRRLILCSGKIVYALAERAAAIRQDDVALVRIEQLYPFPVSAMTQILAKHPKTELIWCQEEPRNQGAFSYVAAMLAHLAPGRRLHYAGRTPMAAAAGGSIDRHEIEQASLLDRALEGVFDNRTGPFVS